MSARAIALGGVELFDSGQDAGDLLGSKWKARLDFCFAEAQFTIGSGREVDPAPGGCGAVIEEDSEKRQVGLAGAMAPARVFFEVLLDMFGADLSQESDPVRFHVIAEVPYSQDVQFHCGGCFLALRGEKGGFGGSECDLFTRLRTYQINADVRRLRVGASGEKLAALGFGRSERPGVEGLTDELAAHAAVNPERALAARHVGGVAGGGVPPVDRQFILIAPASHLLQVSRLDGIFVRYFRSC